MRAIIASGVFVSAPIRQSGTTGDVLRAARDGRFQLVYSTELVVELIDVLGRTTFHEKYHIQADDISVLVNLIRLRGEVVTPSRRVTDCRDPKDDKFLEAALAGSADCVVSGDADLLVLTPFEHIPILRPAEFLARL